MKFNNTDLGKMFEELKTASTLYAPSKYWEELNAIHVKHLAQHGLKHFKRSLNKDYFDWGPTGIVPYQLGPVLSEISKGNVSPFFKSKFIEEESSWKPFYKFQFFSKLIYRIYVAYMYDYITRIDNLGILKKISEPKIGSPLLIKYRNQYMSQNVCSSVQELYSITQHVDINKKLDIVELGAGYGRLAYVFLNSLPKVTYCIIDIPPALYMSQEYLKEVFPKETFFFFRHFNNFKEIEKDFLKARIRFLLPQQIELLPQDIFDVFVNISSFHEMRRDQIKNYIEQAGRISRSFFYFKQWKRSFAKDNDFMKQDEYLIPKKWEKIYHHSDPIHSLFFEALYKIKKT